MIADYRGRWAGIFINTFGEDGIDNRDLRELGTSFKEMLQSVKDLIDELKVTVVESKRSGTLRNIGETVKEASDSYIAITKSARKPEL